MALCVDSSAAIVAGSGIVISGSGTPGDPWVISAVDPVDIVDIENDITNIQAELLTLPATYVNTTGDYMSGSLTVYAPGAGVRVRRLGSQRPFVDFYSDDGLTGQAALVGASTGLELIAYPGGSGSIWFMPDNIIKGHFNNSELMIGKLATGIGAEGIEAHTLGALWVTRSTNGMNIQVNKTGTGVASGTTFCSFQLDGTGIGTITRNAATSAVLYNVSSDADLKENVEAIDDEQALLWMRLVEPVFFTHKGHPEVAQVGYLAQRTLEMWPTADQYGVVSPGHGNVEDRTWDENGQETTPSEVWEGWQMDYSRVAPFVHASVQALDRLTMAQQATIDAQATQIDAQATQIADLTARVEALELIAKPK